MSDTAFSSYARVVIIGGGVAGTHSAKMAVGLEARVTIIEKSLDRIRYLEDLFGSRANIACRVIRSTFTRKLKPPPAIRWACILPAGSISRPTKSGTII